MCVMRHKISDALFVTFIALMLPLSALPMRAEPIHGYFEAGGVLEEPCVRTDVLLWWDARVGPFVNRLYGGFESFYHGDGVLLHPFGAVYRIGDVVRLGVLYAEIDHRCGHPVYSADWPVPERDWSFTTVSLGVRW